MKTSRREFLKNMLICTSFPTVLAPAVTGCKKTEKDLDILLKNGTVIDGSGSPGKIMDIGTKENRIRFMGQNCPLSAERILSVKGLIVSPGFIDVHTHSDISFLVEPSGGSKLRQGVTTEIGGNCGDSVAPRKAENDEVYREQMKQRYNISVDWTDFTGFFKRLEKEGIGINFCTLTGLGTIRAIVMGEDNRRPTGEELSKMKEMIETSMKEGSLGISSGLEYVPSSFAERDEIVELAKAAAKYNGIYATHIRNEDDYVQEAVTEALDTAEKAGISLEISHLKACREKNWHKVDDILRRIHEAAGKGVNVNFDRYPYTAYNTSLSNLFPLWVREGGTEKFIERLKDSSLLEKMKQEVLYKVNSTGSWDSFLISSIGSEKNKKYQGKTVKKIAQETNSDPFEFTRQLLIEENSRVSMVGFAMSDENTKKVLADPLCMIGSDGAVLSTSGPLARGNPHPRNYGTFPRAIAKYVRDDKICSLEEMIRKITSAASKKFRLLNRGLLTEGFFADITVFDYEKIQDKATFSEPHRYPEGITYVIVNGKVVLDNNNFTGKLPGKILKLNS